MVLLVAMAACMSSAAVSVPVYTLCERNLSLDLGSDLKIVPDEDNTGGEGGMFLQQFKIAGRHGQALIQIMDVYDEDTLFLGPELISKSWIMGMNLEAYLFSLDEDSGDRITGNWTATDSMSNNVTVSTLNTSNSMLSVMGKTADLACWNIGENRYAGLISFMDQNTTSRIIGTLKVE